MSTQPEATQANPLQVFRSMLEGKMRAEIAKALPKDIDPDRFIRMVVTAVQMNPDLLDADRRSLFAACMRAAQDGLYPDGREAVLNIYNTKVKQPGGREEWIAMVQYLPMVRGLLKVVRNSGQIAHIDAAAVYERDDFIFERGDDSKLVHRPYLGMDDPGPVVAAYVVARFANGEVHREVMPRRDIEKTREASKSGSGANSPWTKWYDQMAIKAVIKRAAKLLPSSSDRLDRLIQNDNDAMGFETFNQRGTDVAAIQEAPAAPRIEAGKSTRLSTIIGAASTPAQKEPVTIEAGQPAEGGAE